MLIQPKLSGLITADYLALEAAFLLGGGLRKGGRRVGFVMSTRARRKLMTLRRHVTALDVSRNRSRGILFKVVIESLGTESRAFAIVTRVK